MNKIVRHISAWFLLAVFFISTSGFAVFSHFCTMSGDGKTGVKKVESCCASPASETHEKSAAAFEASCCRSDIQYVKLDFDAVKEKPTIKTISHQILLIDNRSSQTIQDVSYSYFDIDQNLPPPKTGRQIILQENLLRI
ncbi:MAG: hypothetical protein H7X71_04175 [Chitinophagales bacterium]|nr:hypothetical protein [Chitinophagales bacterium]